MKLKILLYLAGAMICVYPQNSSKEFERVHSYNLNKPYNLLWTNKTNTEPCKIRLTYEETKTSDGSRVKFINPQSKKTIELSASSSLSTQYYKGEKVDVRRPSFNADTKSIVQSTKSGDTIHKKIFNSDGVLVGEYTLPDSEYYYAGGSFPDGRLFRYHFDSNAYEIANPDATPPLKITGGYKRPLFEGDKWYGYNAYYNQYTRDIFVNTGVLHNGSPAGLVFVVDKNNQILWKRVVYTKYGYEPHLNYSPTGNIFTLHTSAIGRPGNDLLVINRSGQTICNLQNIRFTPGDQVFSSDDKYLITIVGGIELLVYDLSDGEIIKTVRGSGGKNFLSVDYAAQTRQLFLLKRRLEKDRTVVELITLNLDIQDEKFFKGEEIASFKGHVKLRGKISVSDNANNVTALIKNTFYELKRIKK